MRTLLHIFMTGIKEGYESGGTLSVGWTYEDTRKQAAYDLGANIGEAVTTIKWSAGEFLRVLRKP